MLKQHEFYVYHQENRVYARCRAEAPVLAETCATAQEAHDKVQAVLNPAGRSAASFGDKGFLEPEFQAAISDNCRDYVESAYAAVGAG